MEVRPGYKQTEVGVIPEDWGVQLLRDVVDFANGKPHESNVESGGRYWLITLDSIGIDGRLKAEHKRTNVFDASLKANDIVSVLSDIAHGNLLGLSDIIPADEAYVLNQRMGRLRLKAPAVPRFVRHQINRRQEHFRKRGQGTSQKHVYRRDFDSLLIPFPAPAEQERIAEALSDADALVQSLEHLLSKKHQLKQGATQELLTGKKRLPAFNGNWDVMPFGKVAQPRKERIDPRRTGPHEFCIELEHIEQETGCLAGYSATSEGSSLKSVFQRHDVLFGKLRAYLRKYWLASREGVCSTEIWVLTAQPTLILPEFLFQLVKSDRFVEAASSTYGTHMPRSDWNVVKNYEVRLPPIPEQAAMVAVLSDMDAEFGALEAKLAKGQALKQGMMQELLTGRIRLV